VRLAFLWSFTFKHQVVVSGKFHAQAAVAVVDRRLVETTRRSGRACWERTRSPPKIESQFAGRPPPNLITVQLSKPNAFLKNANKSKVKNKLTGPQNHTLSILFCHQAQKAVMVLSGGSQCSAQKSWSGQGTKKIHTVVCEWIGQWSRPGLSGTVTEFCGKGNGLYWLNRDNFCTNRAILVYRINYCPRSSGVN